MAASQNQKTKELYEFGPFRVDPEKETVVRAGELVSITPKTFQILLVLIRNSREIVTKDDLMKTVWPNTFVEETNLSRNIFMLRKALGETAQDHRYIVTIPGQGYRLAEDVRLVPEQELTVVAASHSLVKVEVRESKPWWWMAAAGVLLVAAGAGVWRYTIQHRAALSATDTVVLADFANSTGDAVFDETLRRGLAIQLEQSPFLSLISDQRIQHTLRLMGRPANARLTSEVARGICERTGSAAVLDGSIAPIGSQYVLELRARSCRSGEILDQEQMQAAKKEDVLNVLGQMASLFRKRVGESLTTIQQRNTPLAEATTPSLEALEAYSTGWKLHTTTGTTAALPFMQRAVEIDPNFALAHSTLGREYANVDEFERSRESTTRAWQLREHTSDREKFFIDANYQILATGNLEQARQTCEAWARAYPRDPVPFAMLAGLPSKVEGRYEQAIVAARRAVELDPDFTIGVLQSRRQQRLPRPPRRGRKYSSACFRSGARDRRVPHAAKRYRVPQGRCAGHAQPHPGPPTIGADTWVAEKRGLCARVLGPPPPGQGLNSASNRSGHSGRAAGKGGPVAGGRILARGMVRQCT